MSTTKTASRRKPAKKSASIEIGGKTYTRLPLTLERSRAFDKIERSTSKLQRELERHYKRLSELDGSELQLVEARLDDPDRSDRRADRDEQRLEQLEEIREALDDDALEAEIEKVEEAISEITFKQISKSLEVVQVGLVDDDGNPPSTEDLEAFDLAKIDRLVSAIVEGGALPADPTQSTSKTSRTGSS